MLEVFYARDISMHLICTIRVFVYINMFSSRKLITTPPRGNATADRQEFTPIGGRSRSVETPILSEPPIPNRTLFQPMKNNNHDNTIEGSFDDTLEFEGLTRVERTYPRQNLPLERPLERDFVNNGPYIVEQQERIQQLNKENYGLKLRIAQEGKTFERDEALEGTLRNQIERLLDRIRELEQENRSEEKNDQIQRYKEEVDIQVNKFNEYRHQVEFEMNQYRRQMEDEINLYKKQVEQLELRIDEENSVPLETERLKELLRNREHELDTFKTVIRDRDNQVEDFKTAIGERDEEVENLKSLLRDRQISQESTSKYEDIIEKLENVAHTQRDDIDKLENQTRSQNTDIETLTFQNKELGEKVDYLQGQLASVSRDLEYSKNSHNSAKESDNAEVKHWKEKYLSLQLQYEQLKNTTSKESNKLQQEIHSLQLKLDQVQYNNSSNRDHQVELLKNELLKKDQQVGSLSAEIQQSDYQSKSLREDLLRKENQLKALKNDLLQSNVDLSQGEQQQIRAQNELSLLTEELKHKNEILNKLTSDRRSTVDYTPQIETLKSRNSRLVDEIQELYRTIGGYKADLQTLNAFKGDLEKILDDLRADLRRGNQTIDALKAELRKGDEAIVTLKEDLRRAQSSNNGHEDLKLSSTYKSQLLEYEYIVTGLKDEIKLLRQLLQQRSADVELLDNSSRSRLENMNESLERDRINLVLQVRESAHELEKLKTLLNVSNQRDLVPEIRDLLSANAELKDVLEQYSSKVEADARNTNIEARQIKQLELKINLLENELFGKENLIRQLEASAKSPSYDYTSILKTKSSDEIRIRKLELELENVRKHHQLEIKSLEYELEKTSQLQDKIKSLQYELEKRTKEDDSAIRSLLEEQLREATKLSEELSKLLSDSNETSTLVEQKVLKLERQNNELLQVTLSMESTDSQLKMDKRNLEKKINELNQNLIKVTGHCQKLAGKVNQLTNNHVITDKLGKLNIRENEQINKVKIENSQLQQQLRALLKKINHSDETSLLQAQVTYFKAKLHDFNIKCNDLELIYNFTINCIKNSNDAIQNDINRLVDCGVYPDYTLLNLHKLKRGTPITFKVLATFVLASVRIRRRLERTERRNLKLIELKTEIETGKVMRIGSD